MLCVCWVFWFRCFLFLSCLVLCVWCLVVTCVEGLEGLETTCLQGLRIFRATLFSMKRSLVVFVALGLLAGLVGCGGSGGSTDPFGNLPEAETEARQWLIAQTTEKIKPIFEEIDITSVSAEKYAVCFLNLQAERSPRFGESDYWQQEKALKIDNPNSHLLGGEVESGVYTPEGFAWNACRGVNIEFFGTSLTKSEAERAGDYYDDYYEDLKDTSQNDNDTVTTPVPTPEPTRTVSQQQAEQSAEDYLNYSAFSRSGLIDQLEYEGFSTADATYGVDAQNANWNAQAALMAQDYLDYSSFSRTGLIDQLIFEGFTKAQATYGVNAVGL